MGLLDKIVDNPVASVATGGALGGGGGALLAAGAGAAGVLSGAGSGGGTGVAGAQAGLRPLQDLVAGEVVPGQITGGIASIFGGLGGIGGNISDRRAGFIEGVGQITNPERQGGIKERIGDITGAQEESLAPLIEAGLLGSEAQTQAIGDIQSLLADPSSILNDPVFQAQLSQGIRASERGAAAQGLQLSGGQLSALQQLGQEQAGVAVGQQFERLAGLAGLGAQQAGLGLRATGLQSQTQLAGLGLESEVIATLAQAQSAAALGQAQTQAASDAGKLSFFGDVLGAGTSLLGGLGG